MTCDVAITWLESNFFKAEILSAFAALIAAGCAWYANDQAHQAKELSRAALVAPLFNKTDKLWFCVCESGRGFTKEEIAESQNALRILKDLFPNNRKLLASLNLIEQWIEDSVRGTSFSIQGSTYTSDGGTEKWEAYPDFENEMKKYNDIKNSLFSLRN